MALSATILLVELWAAWRTGSLALLSDAGHVLTDLSGLGLALVALRVASRPATARATYGFARAEVLAALTNGILLVLVVGTILWRAAHRLQEPLPDLDTGMVLLVGAVGLGANLVSAALLRRDAQDSLNTRGAYLDVVGDALASVGVLASAALVRWTGDVVWDTAVSFLVAGIILVSAWRLLRTTGAILLERVPPHIRIEEVRSAVESVPGVVDVHDLHIWTHTMGRHSTTLHVCVAGERLADAHRVVESIEAVLRDRFGLRHSTIQAEPCRPGHGGHGH